MTARAAFASAADTSAACAVPVTEAANQSARRISHPPRHKALESHRCPPIARITVSRLPPPIMQKNAAGCCAFWTNVAGLRWCYVANAGSDAGTGARSRVTGGVSTSAASRVSRSSNVFSWIASRSSRASFGVHSAPARSKPNQP